MSIIHPPDFRESETTMKTPTINNLGAGLIPAKDIVADKKWNVRQQMGNIAELAADIKARGLISPITVRAITDKPGKFSVVLGYRRFAAMTLLGWDDIPATLFQGEETDALLLNLSENTQREDLSTYEIALRCQMLKNDFDISTTTIAASLGKSKSYTENLIRALQQLAKPILDAWANCEHPSHALTSTNNLNRLAAMEHDAQLSRWDEMRGHTPSTDTGDGSATSGASNTSDAPKQRKPSIVRLAEAIEAVKEAELDKELKSAIVSALAWAMGAKTKLTHGRVVLYAPPTRGSKTDAE